MSILEQLAQELAALTAGPYPKGAARVPYGDDGIIPTQPVVSALDMLMTAEAEDSAGQCDWREASYRAGGVYPFVCSECCYFAEDSSCELVVGPYENGAVNAPDTCRFFEPADPMMGGDSGEPEEDESSIGEPGGEPDDGAVGSPADSTEEEDPDGR